MKGLTLFRMSRPALGGGGYQIPWTQDDAYYRPPKFGIPAQDYIYDSSGNFGMTKFIEGRDIQGQPLFERILKTQPDEMMRVSYGSRQYASFAVWLWGGLSFFVLMFFAVSIGDYKRMADCEKGIRKCDVRVHKAFHRNSHCWDGDAWLPYTKEWQDLHQDRSARPDEWLARQQAFFRFIGVPTSAEYGPLMTPVARPDATARGYAPA